MEFRTHIIKHGSVFELLLFMLKEGEEYIRTYIHYRQSSSGLYESPKSMYFLPRIWGKNVF